VTIPPIRFEGVVRFWDPESGGGLAVLDVAPEHIPTIGGLRQQRVRGTINGPAFSSSVMPAGGGRLALSLSKAILASAGAKVGARVAVMIDGVGKD
jgi:hypothetical protein